MKRVLIYSRQSDSDDAGADSDSLRSQEYELQRRAETEGWIVVDTLREPDRRGWQDETKREVFAQVLERAQLRQYDILLFWEIARFARSVRLQENYIWELSKHGVEVCSHIEPWVSSSPMFRQILGSVAEELTRSISRQVTRTIRDRGRRGLPHGVAPFGYARAYPKGPYEIVEEQAGVVRLIFARYVDGWTCNDIARELNRMAVTPPRRGNGWIGETVAAILDNPVFIGRVVLKGEAVERAHPAIVDPGTFATVAARRAQKRRRGPRRKPNPSWVEGLVEHSCGRPMYLFKGFEEWENDRYRCASVSHRIVNQACGIHPLSTAAWMVENAARYQLAQDVAGALPIQAVLAAERSAWREHGADIQRRHRQIAERRRRTEERRERTEELYLSGARERAWFEAQDEAMAAELAAIEAEETQLPQAPDPSSLADAAARLTSLRPIVLEASSERLREILRELGVVVVAKNSITIRYHDPYARFLVPD